MEYACILSLFIYCSNGEMHCYAISFPDWPIALSFDQHLMPALVVHIEMFINFT